jgi:hypothetical protein
MTIPGFSRIEIRTADKLDLINAGGELRQLADELSAIATSAHTPDEAIILAHHKIKAVSQRLRNRPEPAEMENAE